MAEDQDRVVQNRPTTCLIGLGGNVGPVSRTFVEALETLDREGCHVVSRSEFHRSAPMGSDAGGTFTNAAASVCTELGPVQLLELLQKVESNYGRVRTVHWGPRPLDLDLLFYGQQVIQSERLRVPHPHLWYRRFVLDPLLEIAPQWIHPQNAHTIAELRRRLDQRPLVIEVDGVDVLPPVPNRYHDNIAQVRNSTASQSGRSAAQQPFCSLHVQTGDRHSQTKLKSKTEEFQIDVQKEKVARLIDDILSAALGQ